ncbi:glioma pathogenesis-related protein 1 [Xyrichtys novacula]|uniref:Glioma pathogenesis-related protein 1 n=1 Tax=Xyrichtys novacula TaxID=13765 RepID=A0AAV1F4G4_XYRNO|nr:glioma pathogenesis-related protein 1 [Xyrichtys novacula]
MGCSLEGLLWAWIILNSGVCSVILPEITDRRFIAECVKGHNRARSAVSPPASNMEYMTWDEDLAIIAKGWAENCVFEHNPRRSESTATSVGENIWTGYPPSSFETAGAIHSWDNEKEFYDYANNRCSKVCGHYTQVVWASSNKVGCAAHLCPNGVQESGFGAKAGVIFVCNYAPSGNVNRRRPYDSEGAACSGCEGACVDNLCRSGWAPESQSQIVDVLVVRLIVLIFTFVAAYAVRHFYPDIFCYE